MADSTPIRNVIEDLLKEEFEGHFESDYPARAIVEPLLDALRVRIGDGAEIGLPWQVLTRQPVQRTGSGLINKSIYPCVRPEAMPCCWPARTSCSTLRTTPSPAATPATARAGVDLPPSSVPVITDKARG